MPLRPVGTIHERVIYEDGRVRVVGVYRVARHHALTDICGNETGTVIEVSDFIRERAERKTGEEEQSV